jgi:hypothetical protein
MSASRGDAPDTSDKRTANANACLFPGEGVHLADTLEIISWRSRLPMASSFVKPGDVLAHIPYFAKQAPPWTLIYGAAVSFNSVWT